MSFNSNFKSEILDIKFDTNAEKFAFVSAVLRICGSIHIDSKGVNLQMETENYLLISKFTQVLKEIYDIEIEVNINNNGGIYDKSFTADMPYDITRKIATETGMVEYIGDMPVGFSDGVGIELNNEGDIKAYLLGIVVSCVSITVPQQGENEENVYSGGYHLEMVFSSEQLAYDIMSYFAEFEILMKKIARGEMFGLYIKDSNMICDFMAFFGANMSVIEVNNIIVARSVRNDVNRVNNCLIANIEKAVEAGQKQYIAIKSIDRIAGLDILSPKLKELADMRLNNPDFTLDQIVEEMNGAISKSGINHRFRKIIEIAKKLEEEDE